MKDSAVLLQKRLVQEPAERDEHTLHTYKVSRPASRDPAGALCCVQRSTSVLLVMQEFLHWFCVTLMEVLLPGASFSKCLMSLQLLCLLGQTFTFSSGETFQRVRILLSSSHSQVVLFLTSFSRVEFGRILRRQTCGNGGRGRQINKFFLY